jgi:hypothetical protein
MAILMNNGYFKSSLNLLWIMGLLMTKCPWLLGMRSYRPKTSKIVFLLKNWPMNMCVDPISLKIAEIQGGGQLTPPLPGIRCEIACPE